MKKGNKRRKLEHEAQTERSENDKRYTKFPMLRIRDLIRNNQFIIETEYGTHLSQYMNRTHRKKKNIDEEQKFWKTFIEDTDKFFPPSELQINQPFTVKSKAEINTLGIFKKEIRERKKSERVDSFLRRSFPLHRDVDFVANHSLGYKNENNKDLFKHYYRLYIVNSYYIRKTEALRSEPKNGNADNKEKFGSDVEEEENVEYITLPMKEFIINRSLLDLNMYNKIIELYKMRADFFGQKISEDSPPKRENSQILTDRFSDLKRRKSARLTEGNIENEPYRKGKEKLFREDIFINNLLKKVTIQGVKSIESEDFNLFQDIVKKRSKQLAELKAQVAWEKRMETENSRISSFASPKPKKLDIFSENTERNAALLYRELEQEKNQALLEIRDLKPGDADKKFIRRKFPNTHTSTDTIANPILSEKSVTSFSGIPKLKSFEKVDEADEFREVPDSEEEKLRKEELQSVNNSNLLMPKNKGKWESDMAFVDSPREIASPIGEKAQIPIGEDKKINTQKVIKPAIRQTINNQRPELTEKKLTELLEKDKERNEKIINYVENKAKLPTATTVPLPSTKVTQEEEAEIAELLHQRFPINDEEELNILKKSEDENEKREITTQTEIVSVGDRKKMEDQKPKQVEKRTSLKPESKKINNNNSSNQVIELKEATSIEKIPNEKKTPEKQALEQVLTTPLDLAPPIITEKKVRNSIAKDDTPKPMTKLPPIQLNNATTKPLDLEKFAVPNQQTAADSGLKTNKDKEGLASPSVTGKAPLNKFSRGSVADLKSSTSQEKIIAKRKHSVQQLTSLNEEDEKTGNLGKKVIDLKAFKGSTKDLKKSAEVPLDRKGSSLRVRTEAGEQTISEEKPEKKKIEKEKEKEKEMSPQGKSKKAVKNSNKAGGKKSKKKGKKKSTETQQKSPQLNGAVPDSVPEIHLNHEEDINQTDKIHPGEEAIHEGHEGEKGKHDNGNAIGESHSAEKSDHTNLGAPPSLVRKNSPTQNENFEDYSIDFLEEQLAQREKHYKSLAKFKQTLKVFSPKKKQEKSENTVTFQQGINDSPTFTKKASMHKSPSISNNVEPKSAERKEHRVNSISKEAADKVSDSSLDFLEGDGSKQSSRKELSRVDTFFDEIKPPSSHESRIKKKKDAPNDEELNNMFGDPKKRSGSTASTNNNNLRAPSISSRPGETEDQRNQSGIAKLGPALDSQPSPGLKGEPSKAFRNESRNTSYINKKKESDASSRILNEQDDNKKKKEKGRMNTFVLGSEEEYLNSEYGEPDEEDEDDDPSFEDIKDIKDMNYKELKSRLEMSLRKGHFKDEEAKYNAYLYKHRKDQMEKHLQSVQATIEENIMNQPDCIDQLKNFFEKRDKFLKENKDKGALKFSNNVANTNSGGLLETLKVTTEYKEQDLEKIFKIVRFNNDFDGEVNRKHLFKVECLMLKRLRNFVNTFQSKVVQDGMNRKQPENSQKGFGKKFTGVISSQRITDDRPKSNTVSRLNSETSLDRDGFIHSLRKLKKQSPNVFKDFLMKSNMIRQQGADLKDDY